MTRPQVIVNVTAAVPRRGAPSPTGTAFIVYADTTGTPTPVVCLTSADATASLAPATVVQYVADALEQGAPKVVLLRATAATPATVTQTEWDTALGLLTLDYGMGQVLIPGVSTAAAYASLLNHANLFNRTALLDTVTGATAAAITSTVSGLAAAAGSTRATMLTHVLMPAAAGTTRVVPGSVIAAGLAARGDAYAGHANNAPIFEGKSGQAGVVDRGAGIQTVRSDADLNTLYDAGVSAFVVINGITELSGWTSISSNRPSFRQLNWGRMTMQIQGGANSGMHQFLGRQHDGRGKLLAEAKATLTGYLTPLWLADALYGQTAGDAFDVIVDATNNTPITIGAGELHASVGVKLTPYTEKVYIDVVTSIADGVIA